jgi:hypothetical protein
MSAAWRELVAERGRVGAVAWFVLATLVFIGTVFGIPAALYLLAQP